MYGVGPVAQERTDVVHRTGLPAFDHERRVRPAARPDQVVVHGPHGEQTRDGKTPRPRAAVRQEENFGTPRHGLPCVPAHPLDGGLQASLIPERRVDRRRPDAVRVDVVEGVPLRVAQEGRVEVHLSAVLGALREQIALAPDVAFQRGDQLLTDVVEGRIGDLRKQLLEVGKERLALVREHGGRGVVAHRAHRVRAVVHHRLHEAPDVLPRVAEGPLSPGHGIRLSVQGAWRP
jgi:hypothetical protein